MRSIELLAPAGNRECLETALYFGADAVYAAGKSFGLRAFADNFSDEDLAGAVEDTHRAGKKFYVTVNAVLYNDEMDALVCYLRYLEDLQADGVIFSDPAVLLIAKENGVHLPLHLSTQANTTNFMAARFWHGQGVGRIVLSRETSLAQIAGIRRRCPETLELEAFVHGAMCIAYSGRCLMSSVLTGRSGNRGACAQPCRWEYFLHEKGYDGQYFPVMEDGRGTYVLNSKDLMMIEHIPELIGAGVTSFKIEGRMKSAYYVASVVSAYRRALDRYLRDGAAYRFDERLKEELVKSATRPFTTGFFFGNPGAAAQDVTRDEIGRKYTFAAKVTENGENGYIKVEQRNKFCVGETLETLSPHCTDASFVVTEIKNEAGQGQQSAPHPQQALWLRCPLALRRGDILRRHD